MIVQVDKFSRGRPGVYAAATGSIRLESLCPTLPPSTRARARAREAIGNQRPWPADRVERWAIERLIPYAKNARTHTDAQIAAIAASIKEWGWTSPALVGEAWRPNRGPRQGARCPAAGHRRDPGDGRGGLERGAKGKSPISSRARRVSPATLSSSRPSRSAAVSAAHAGGSPSKISSPSAKVIQGCLLRVQIWRVGRSHDVSSNVPARTRITPSRGWL